MSKSSADEFLHNIGANRVFGDARIEVENFVRGLIKYDKNISREEAEDVSRLIDTDMNGWIDVNELCAQLKGSSALVRVKEAIKGKNLLNGLSSVNRVLKRMDTSGDKALDRREFRDGFLALGLTLTSQDIEDLFAYFDKDKNGKISIEEFFVGLCGVLNDRRRKFVEIAFNRMDRDGSGEITFEDIENIYDVSENPEVKSGKKSPKQALKEFLQQFDQGDKDGIITEEEFLEYYRCLSASIENDDYFELMMRNAWHISGGKGQCQNTTNRRVLVTHIDGTQTVEEIEDNLWVDKDSEGEMKRVLKKKGVNAVGKIDKHYSHEQSSPKSKSQFRLESRKSNFSQRIQKKSSVDRAINSTRDSKPAWGAVSKAKRSLRNSKYDRTEEYYFPQEMDLGDEAVPGSSQFDIISDSLKQKPSKTSLRRSEPPIVGRMLKKVLARGGSNGIQTLGRVLRIMDDSGDKCLNRYELKNGLKDYGVEFSEEEINDMFDYLDKDQSGKVSFDEFLVGLRGPISKRRKDLILSAFRKLDRNKDGFVTIEDLEMTYDPSHIPEVKSGKLTKAEGLREFLSQFDTIDKDGIVTQEEFVEYYKNVSASIDTDDYFELMLRNAWHLSGGQGQCKNTSNRRVLISHQNGKQTIQEIEDDLWLDYNNEDEMRHRLEKRGIKAIRRLGKNYSSEKSSVGNKNAINSTISLAWDSSKSKNKNTVEKTRRIRNGAAKQIQSIARAHKCKRVASNLRRQQKAKSELQIEIEKENERDKSKIYRPKGKNWY
uniref:EF-hand domain-containing protein n=1 Tax=Aplanochytrium stocchinoi TaxID=215587 RepID=A0A7S3PJB3_9STRA